MTTINWEAVVRSHRDFVSAKYRYRDMGSCDDNVAVGGHLDLADEELSVGQCRKPPKVSVLARVNPAWRELSVCMKGSEAECVDYFSEFYDSEEDLWADIAVDLGFRANRSTR